MLSIEYKRCKRRIAWHPPIRHAPCLRYRSIIVKQLMRNARRFGQGIIKAKFTEHKYNQMS